VVIAVTGGTGFLGWHARARAAALGLETTTVDRATFADDAELEAKVRGATAIIHFAGVNRASDDSIVAEQNPWLATRLVETLQKTGQSIPIIYANSTHSEGASVFGKAKQQASELLAAHQSAVGAPYLDLVIPHVFGEYGTPFYNSGVTTFAHQLAHGAFANLFELRMFNMLRSQLYLNGHYPQAITLHEDARGAFSELARADGVGQTSISTSVPGITRGDHFHFDKIERFVVVGGTARIRLRQVLTDEIQSFDVTGKAPMFIDMPPLCTHNITNTGDDVMTTVFWAGDHFDPGNPDTYVDPVEPVPSLS